MGLLRYEVRHLQPYQQAPLPLMMTARTELGMAWAPASAQELSEILKGLMDSTHIVVSPSRSPRCSAQQFG
jgi:hypothetical protein